jgi:arylamine N-acetyltransferase
MHQVLKHWGLSLELPPTAETLALLHGLWLEHVPFENLTKLLAVSSRPRSQWRREADRFWRDHVEQGTGGTCFAATAACVDLLRSVGFEPRKVFCDMPGGRRRAHVAILVRAANDLPRANAVPAEYLVDVAFPMPEPIPLPHGTTTVRRRTPFYDVIVMREADRKFLVLTEDSRGIQFRYSFRRTPVGEVALRKAWGATFLPRAPYMGRLALGRFRGDTRFIYKGPNSLFALRRDRQELMVVPAGNTATLSEIFGLGHELLAAASGFLEKKVLRPQEPPAWHELRLKNLSRLPE